MSPQLAPKVFLPPMKANFSFKKFKKKVDKKFSGQRINPAAGVDSKKVGITFSKNVWKQKAPLAEIKLFRTTYTNIFRMWCPEPAKMSPIFAQKPECFSFEEETC